MDKKLLKKIIKYFIIIVISLSLLCFILNIYVVLKVKNRIINKDDYSKITDVQCIIVLGAGIKGDRPSPLLQDRLDKAIELYKLGLAPKILMSGDHGNSEHDEVNVMKNYAIENGVLSEDIFMDHAGFSTYDTMYRAKEIFGIKKAIIVTQKYHIYRSIYIAEKLGIESYGVACEDIKHSYAVVREIREVLARDKDVFKCIFKPRSKYLGDKIDISGNGDITNDK